MFFYALCRIVLNRSGVNKFVIAILFQSHDFIIELYACPCINGGILFLLVGEYGSLPVAQTLAFGDFLMEDIGVNLLKT